MNQYMERRCFRKCSIVHCFSSYLLYIYMYIYQYMKRRCFRKCSMKGIRA